MYGSSSSSTENMYRLKWNKDFGNSWTSIYWVTVLLIASLVILLVSVYITARIGSNYERLAYYVKCPGILNNGLLGKNKKHCDTSTSSTSYNKACLKHKAESGNQKNIEKLLCKPINKRTKYIIQRNPQE